MGSNPSIYHKMKTTKILGLTETQLGSAEYAASTGNNPASLWYWNIAFFDALGASNISVVFNVTLSYDCIFYDRTDPGMSRKLVVADKDYRNEPGDVIQPVTNAVTVDPTPLPVTLVGMRSDIRGPSSGTAPSF